MVKVGVMIRIEAKPDRADELEATLQAALSKIQQDEPTIVWLALRLGPTTFSVVDAFLDEAGRQAHLDAYLGALQAAAPELLSAPPSIEYTDVVAAKLPG
ncbi:antibiotic biosynthesis monooxygenase [Nocardia sp. NPDC004604]|uniref:putative quinol monooxygenase n=1 Tax=Nocardia sp. NPDC004604 TaxID=3157013 RepID=UPI0033B9ECB3